MMALPADYRPLVQALVDCVQETRAGLLHVEHDDNPDLVAAALDEASERAGLPIHRAWIGHDRIALAWLRTDDDRLRLCPTLSIVGVSVRG